MATEDERYRQSTQYRLWSFTPSHLSSMREKANNLARTHISSRLRAASPPVDPLPEFLTTAEEMTLVNLYTVELLRAANEFNLPTDIQATAAILLRRFYTTNSIMTYPPMSLMKTCIFFGCKAEGHYMRLSKFAGFFPNTAAGEILAAEYILCQGIRFAFDVKHPYRALEGAVMELRRLGEFDEVRINRAHDKAREILKFSPLVTDAYFHYAPSQIMLAALSIVDKELVERILRDAFAGQGEAAKEKASSLLESCKETLRKEPPERKTEYWGTPACHAEIKPPNRKLKKCRDPDRVDLVALQKAKREQAMQKTKPKAHSALKEDGDVFGGSLADPQRENKRRKVASNGNDPIGPPL